MEKKVSFDILFGKCPICGGTADYWGDPLDPPSAAEDTGNGYELVDYKGEKMCPKCKKTKMMEDESRPDMDRANAEDEERAEMGFTKTYTA